VIGREMCIRETNNLPQIFPIHLAQHSANF